jgi:basic membrane protein A
MPLRTNRFAAASLVLVVLSGALAACAVDTSKAEEVTRVAFVVNGTLGDRSTFDSAQAGLGEIAETYDYDVETIELGADPTTWDQGFEEAAAGDYDILVAGTPEAAAIVSRLAAERPDKRFWVFDDAVAYDGADGGCADACENVASITFAHQEGGYLAGFLAAQTLAAHSLPGAESATRAGVIGAAETPAITAYIAGFDAGFAAGGGAPDAVDTQYIGGAQPFADATRAGELAATMSAGGVGIVWPIAGFSAYGAFESVAAAHRYAIGTDSDQSETLVDEAQRKTILTSIVEDVGDALLVTAEKDAAGTLDYGATASFGVADGAIDYIDNEQFRSLVPAPVRDALAAEREKIVRGEVTVPAGS